MPPVTLPVIAPTVQIKLLVTLAVKVIFGLVPLHVLTVDVLVIAGVGYTVTVIANGEPGHKPAVEVGVTIYCTVPFVELLGLVSV